MDKENNLFEDYLKSARDLILERVSSPFIFSFVISWLISNYKIIMVILTDQTDYYLLEYKIWLVNEYINYCNSLIYPLIGATLYTFVYPFADRKITTFTLNRKLEKRDAIHKIEKTQLKTAEEVEAIHRRHFDVEQNLSNQINQARITEDQLRAKIQELEKDVKKLPKVKTDVTSEPTLEEFAEPKLGEVNATYKITATDASVLAILGSKLDNNIKWVQETELHESSKKLNIAFSKIKLSLGRLKEEGYLTITSSGSCQLTTKGIEAYSSFNEKIATRQKGK